MDKKMISILQALDVAKAPTTVAFVSVHTHIVDPLPLIESLEKDGYVHRIAPQGAASGAPTKFEMTPKAVKELSDIESSVLKVPLKVVKDNLTRK
jgi:hypothetical protein